MYNNYYRNHQNYIYDERFGGFMVPLLLGGLGGAAIVGLSRPQPVVVNPTPQFYYPPYQQYPFYY